MSFDHLGLRVELLSVLKAKGYTAPTPIQAQAIPVILGGQDILARAQTGTGKTDAFALPLVEILSRENSKGRHPRALVLTPTRELALQVAESIKGYARRVSMRCTVVYGGVRINPQIDRLRRGNAIEAIKRPAEGAGRSFDDEAATSLVDSLLAIASSSSSRSS